MEPTIRYRMVVRKPRPGPLTPGDWARAALAAIARERDLFAAGEPLSLETYVEVSSGKQAVGLPAGDYVDLISGQPVHAPVSIAPRSGLVLGVP